MLGTLRNLIKDEAGATAIEYGLIAALVAVALIGALQALEDDLSNTFNSIGNSLGGTSSTTNGS